MITQTINPSENRTAELAVLIDELTARLQAGEPVDMEQVMREHAEYADDLAELIPAIVQLVNLSGSNMASDAGPRAVGESFPELADFRILREIGRGGMGIVYEAVQVSLGRRVALKVLPRAATLDPKQLERFKNEAKAVASLRHEHIVHVYGVGCEQGVHYYSMEFVDGQTLAQHIRSVQVGGERPAAGFDATFDHIPCRTAPTHPSATILTERSGSRQRDFYRTAATLIKQAAEALEHAHSLGIVHRDVKPGNLLLDSAGGLWVSDFGLARLGTDGGLTVTGDLLGTLRYMSPEQALGKHNLVDHRTDVYSLGVTLYELLTLRPAFTGADREELLRQVTSEEPLPPRRLSGTIPAELETIVLKAMSKEPGSRYPTASVLAADLARFLAGEPIHARPVGRIERLRRWGRCNPAPAVACLLGLVAFTAVVALGVGSVFAMQLGEEQERTQAALQQAEEQQQETKAALQKAEAAKAAADEQRGRANEYLRQTERLATKMTIERGLALCEYENAARGMLWLARSLEKSPAHATDLQRASRENLAGWQHQIHPLKAVLQHQKIVMRAAFSPNGKTIATRDANGTTQLWEAATGKPVGVPMEHPGWGGWYVEFSPDSKTLVTPGGASKTARLWDASTGQPIGEPLIHPNDVYVTHFSPDGKTLLTTSGDETGQTGDVRLWEVATRKSLGEVLWPGAGIAAAAFSPDGKMILIAGGQVAQLFESATGKPLGESLPSAGNARVAFSPDGKTFVTAGSGSTPGTGEARLWEAATGKPLGTVMRHNAKIYAVAFSPDGQTIVTGSDDETARLWEASTGNPLGAPLQHQGNVWAVAFSPDSKAVVTGSFDRTARLWETATGKPIGSPLSHGGDVFTVAFSPDGTTLLAASREMATRLWKVGTGNLPGTTLRHPPSVAKVALSPDGKTVATAGLDKAARLWDAVTGKPLGAPLQHDAAVFTVAFSPDGKTLATGSGEGSPGAGGVARLWDVATGNPIGTSLEHKDTVRIAVFSPDGKTLATATQQTPIREARLWDVATGQPIGAPLQHQRRLWALAFSPDSKTILTGSWDSAAAAQLWDVSTGKALGQPIQHPNGYLHVVVFSPHGKTILLAGGGTQLIEAATGKHLRSLETNGLIVAAAFSPDGQMVVTGSQENKFARLWDVANGKSIGKPMPHEGAVIRVAFSPDSKTVLTASQDKTARLWDATTGDPISPAFKHHGAVSDAAFSPNGKTILTASWNGTARLWQLPTPVTGDAERIVLWTQVITGLELDSDDLIRVLDATTWEQRRQRLQELGGPPQ